MAKVIVSYLNDSEQVYEIDILPRINDVGLILRDKDNIYIIPWSRIRHVVCPRAEIMPMREVKNMELPLVQIDHEIFKASPNQKAVP